MHLPRRIDFELLFFTWFSHEFGFASTMHAYCHENVMKEWACLCLFFEIPKAGESYSASLLVLVVMQISTEHPQ